MVLPGDQDKCFGKAVRDYVFVHFRSSFSKRLPSGLEFIVYTCIAYFLLAQFGSPDAAYDFGLEKFLAVPFALLVMFVIHGLWVWAKAPRALYKDQQRELQKLDSENKSLHAKLLNFAKQQSAVATALDKLNPPDYPNTDTNKQKEWPAKWDVFVKGMEAALGIYFHASIVRKVVAEITNPETPLQNRPAVARLCLRMLKARLEPSSDMSDLQTPCLAIDSKFDISKPHEGKEWWVSVRVRNQGESPIGRVQLQIERVEAVGKDKVVRQSRVDHVALAWIPCIPPEQYDRYRGRQLPVDFQLAPGDARSLCVIRMTQESFELMTVVGKWENDVWKPKSQSIDPGSYRLKLKAIAENKAFCEASVKVNKTKRGTFTCKLEL